MEFMKYKQKEIGERIRIARDKQGIRQEKMESKKEPFVRISANQVSAIEQGKLYGQNKSYLTSNMQIIIDELLTIPRSELYFGNESQQVSFVKNLFYEVSLNIHPALIIDMAPIFWAISSPEILGIEFKNCEINSDEFIKLVQKLDIERIFDFVHEGKFFHRELNGATRKVQEALRCIAPLSYVTRKVRIKDDDEIYYHFDKNLIDATSCKFFLPGLGNRTKEAQPYFTYIAYLSLLWECSKRDLMISFKENILNKAQNIQYKKLDNEIQEWLLNSFIKVIENIENRFKSCEVLKIGYDVFEMRQPIIDSCYSYLRDKQIEIEYSSNQIRKRENNPAYYKDAKMLSGHLDFTFFSKFFEPSKIEECKNEEGVIQEKVLLETMFSSSEEFISIREKYNDKGKYLKIPDIFSTQNFVVESIKYKTDSYHIDLILNMQSAFLQFSGIDEMVRFVNSI